MLWVGGNLGECAAVPTFVSSFMLVAKTQEHICFCTSRLKAILQGFLISVSVWQILIYPLIS